MTRRTTGQSFSLTVRMILVCALLLASYAALGALSVWLVVRGWSHSALVVLIPALLAFLVLMHVTVADSMVLSRARARRIPAGGAPELETAVERLAALAGIAPPQLALSALRTPTALAVGTTRERATIAVTEELRQRLDPRELEAVLAHELSHIANRDTIVLTVAGFFRTLAGALDARALLGASDLRLEDDPSAVGAWALHLALAPARWALLLYGGLLTRALTRYRDFAADRGAALLTGAPEQLMSALQKLSDEQERIPAEDLRQLASANQFLIVSTRIQLPGFLREHPPLAKRLARLATIAREMGRSQ